jgi:hypothetical protein
MFGGWISFSQGGHSLDLLAIDHNKYFNPFQLKGYYACKCNTPVLPWKWKSKDKSIYKIPLIDTDIEESYRDAFMSHKPFYEIHDKLYKFSEERDFYLVFQKLYEKRQSIFKQKVDYISYEYFIEHQLDDDIEYIYPKGIGDLIRIPTVQDEKEVISRSEIYNSPNRKLAYLKF